MFAPVIGAYRAVESATRPKNLREQMVARRLAARRKYRLKVKLKG